MFVRPLRLCVLLLAMPIGVAMSAAAAPADGVVPDTIAQRVLACTACHGKEGIATDQGYVPRIAGKPDGYLYNQLVAFRDGRRHNRTMSALIENMSDAYLMEIAAYFAALDLPYAAPTGRQVPAREMNLGQKLVRDGDLAKRLPACTGCHGSNLTGVAPTVPALVGLSKGYLLAQLGAWRAGERQAKRPDCMREISRRLSIDDLGAVTSYLVQQPVPTDMRPQEKVSLPLPLECGSIGP